MRYIQWLGLFSLLILMSFNQLNYSERSNITNQYRVSRTDYTFSTIFDMASDREAVGSVVKNIFHVSTHYDSYDRFGLYTGTGICRLFCLGIFYSWATEIDVYDEHSQYEGMIDGQTVAAEPAKFSFYNTYGQCVGIGYLDPNCEEFSIMDPDNSSLILARLTRHFIAEVSDHWNVVIYHPERIPSQLVKIFAAFVCDTQDQFKPDS